MAAAFDTKRRSLPVWAALALAVLCAFPAKALGERLPIKVYTTADGLPRDYITSIVEDSKGFMWFCTTEGLSRFDGYKFTNYGIDQGLPDRQVNAFLESRDGVYWVGTGKGLCRFVPDPLPEPGAAAPRKASRFVPCSRGEEPFRSFVKFLYEDRSGAIWCGAVTGLFRLEQGNGEPALSLVDFIQPAADGGSLEVEAAIQDRQGSLWVIAQSGLHRRRPDGSVELYTIEEGLPSGFLTSLIEDREGRIWVGAARGLYQLVQDPQPHRPVVARVSTVRDGLHGGAVSTLFQASDGKIWIGSWAGVSEFDPPAGNEGPKFETYTTANGLSGGAINALAEDRDGNLWIGSATGGAMRLTANGFTTYDKADGLNETRIGSIVANRAGALCVVAGASICRFDHGRFTSVPVVLPRGVAGWGWGWAQIMFEDSAGEWWINTCDGLIRYPRLSKLEEISRARPKAIYKTADGLATNLIFRLFEDSRGDIWISTLGDRHAVLTRWERSNASFHIFSPADGIPDSAPTAFCEDAAGNLWIGFYGGELLRRNAAGFTPFPDIAAADLGLIRGLYCDHAGRLWIASGSKGLVRIDRPDEERLGLVFYSTAQGLSSNQATCVLEDQWGMIYAGTGRGVDKLDPATGRIRHFTTADGLASSFVNVAFRDRDGLLWFGTLQGLSRLVPQPERPAPPPSIRITGLQVAGAPYALPELGAENLIGPELSASKNHVQIIFSGLSLAAAESLRYQYRLEGAASEWSSPTDQRVVSYASLAPGSYRFLVRAVNADGAFSASPAVVSFTVLPPIWKRWWFQSVALVFLALPILAVARYRYQRIQATREAENGLRRSREERLAELERVRTRIATDLHDDIGSTLSQIYLLSEVARQRIGRAEPEVTEPLSMISAASHEAVSAMSDIVWAIDPEKDHLSDLVHRMRRFAGDTFAASDIALRFQAPDGEADLRLGANVRRELFLIFKESVNNLVKHSRCTEACIELQVTEHSIVLKVADNGRGFDPGAGADGHGLPNLRERAKGIGGALDLVSRCGVGTEVTLRLPFDEPLARMTTAASGEKDALE